MIDELTQENPAALLIEPRDQFDAAIVGICREDDPPVALYSVKKCVLILVSSLGCSESEALEYFGFNISGAYLGENTPAYLEDRDENRKNAQKVPNL